MEIHVLKVNTALIVPCQHNEAFPGSCSRHTLVHLANVTEDRVMAYITCEVHGTFRRAENRRGLTVTKKNNARVVR